MTVSRLLVTGAAGFLGSEIVRQATSAGLPIIATARAGAKAQSGFDFIPADILDPVSLSKAFEHVDGVCHAAGLVHVINPLSAPFHEVNVTGSENVAHAAAGAGVRHVVFISSVSVYGGVARGNDEASACYPEGPYAESKLKAEERLVRICRKEGLDLTILRLATLYGQGDRGNVARLIRTIDRGRFVWIGKGDNLKSLLYCEDAARACIEAIRRPVSGINIYNVAAPACKLSDIVATIALALGKPVPSWHVPASLVLKSASFMKRLSFNRGGFVSIHNTVHKWLADDHYNADKFCGHFNFRTYTDLNEGIRKEVAWYQSRNDK